MKLLLLLVWEFFKVGLFSVGGGLATLPFLKVLAGKYDWFTTEDLLNMLAVSESTPGPIGVNTATYAGFHAAGLPGAIAATFGLVLPSVLIILCIARALTRFRDSPLVQDAFYGLRPASAGLILGAMAEVFLSTFFHADAAYTVWALLSSVHWPSVLLFCILLGGIRMFPRLHPLCFIGAGAVAGILLSFES